MADTHGQADHGHGSNVFKLYMAVAVALSVCTAASFVVNQFVTDKNTAFALILLVACVKAVLVGYIFMHLKWDWSLLYFLIVPVSILGVMMIIVLLPDVFFGILHDNRDQLKLAEQFARELKK
ncbi:MAG: cytochrome C oxidase subunit IV family protein [Gemmataceae bacterium]